MDIFSNDIKLDDLNTAVRLLQESRAGFLTLFNNSPVCMSMTTTNLGQRIYVRVNQKFLEIFGFSESEIVGRTSVEIGILDPTESARVAQIIHEKGRLQNDYVKCVTKNGEVVHTLSSIEKMELNGELFLVSFFVDVTRIIEQQVIIEQHARQLEDVNRELEAFSYSVSHDLRTPLRAIDGYAKTLEDEYHALFDEEAKRMLTAVQRNARRMGSLIDALLAFARLGRKSVRKSEIDMASLVQDVLMDVTKQTQCQAEIEVGEVLPLNGDYSLIRQVIEHLLGNAIKFSSRIEAPKIRIASFVDDNSTVYTISDNGAGFDMRYVDKLFGVFHRLHADDQFEGTGVGLAIVKRIIMKHGGSVKAQGELGKGASFTFSLPRLNRHEIE